MSHGLDVGLGTSLYLGLLLAGLGGSLHCLGMCGPILLAFSEVRNGPLSKGAALRASLAYHAGRVWTYGVLGLAAGWLGSELRAAASVVGWQRGLGAAFGVLAVAAGLAAVGLVPRWRLDMGAGACRSLIGKHRWLSALARGHALLLGAVMGLLPCGLVYAALAVSATLPTPWHAALGMLVFGAGTVPALTGLVVTRAALPTWATARSSTWAGLLLIGAGIVILTRATG